MGVFASYRGFLAVSQVSRLRFGGCRECLFESVFGALAVADGRCDHIR